jgi:hypothetical protein
LTKQTLNFKRAKRLITKDKEQQNSLLIANKIQLDIVILFQYSQTKISQTKASQIIEIIDF